MARLRLSLLAAVVLGAAPALTAQQPAAAAPPPATHTVKRGDTLWDLAKQYLGDAYLWPEIYRLNTAVIEDPHWIYPGEILKLPAGVAAEPQLTGGPATAGDGHTTTIFDPRRYKRPRGTRKGINLLEAKSAVRRGEYLAAPFVWVEGGPAGAGRVRSTASSQIVVPQIEERVFQSQEPIFVTLPLGASRANGERFMTYKLGQLLPGQGQVILPTGIIEISGDGGMGDVRAVIVDRFRPVEVGQGITQLDTLAPRVGEFPSAVEFGTATTVSWLIERPVIAQQGSYLVLKGTAKEGFVPGDQVTVFAGLGKGAAGEVRAPEAAAVVQVMRVTPYGASAMILRRSQAEIAVGMPARITAKMP